MGEERRVCPTETLEPISSALGLVAHPLELAACPPDDIGVDPLQGRAQLRPIEVAVVGDPAADARVVHLGQLSQGLVAAVMQRPASDFPADARQRLRAGGGLETVRKNTPVRLHPHYLPGSKLEAQKVEVDVGEVAPPVHILAVDDPRLLLMQHQLAGREAVGNRTPECPRLLGALAVTDDVVRVALKRNVRKRPRHPHVERVVQDRFASSGEITPPCGVPAVRGTTLPSSICTGAFSQRSMESSTQ